MSRQNWWKTLFNTEYLALYSNGLTRERTAREIDFVVKTISMKRGNSILDLACGHGRHSIELAKRGFNVVGLDYSKKFLDKARKDATHLKIKVNFAQGDMRKLKFEKDFDVVLCLFSSFGYFNDTDNLKTLDGIARALKRKGKFLLDVINAYYIFNIFRKNGEKIEENNSYRLDRFQNFGNYRVQITQYLDVNSQIEHNHRIWLQNGKSHTGDYYFRHYTLEEYKKMFKRVGLKFLAAWGDYSDEPYRKSSPRTIILAER